jgi:hypothetical protein
MPNAGMGRDRRFGGSEAGHCAFRA